MAKYSKGQLQELYDELPEELKKAIFSGRVSYDIYNICKENGIKNEIKISQISEDIGHLFLGLIAPEEFKKTLEKEIGLKKETAKNVYFGITKLIFLPLKKELEGLYKIKIEIEEDQKTAQLKKSLEKKSVKKDVYREPTE